MQAIFFVCTDLERDQTPQSDICVENRPTSDPNPVQAIFEWYAFTESRLSCQNIYTSISFMNLHDAVSYGIMVIDIRETVAGSGGNHFYKRFSMKFRFRILSSNQRRQRDVRNFGLLLLIIGFCLHDPGHSSLKSFGTLMLLWSGMSWLAQKAWNKEWIPDVVWVHVIALGVLILLEIQVGHVIRTTESAIDTFSEQILQQGLSKPPEKRKPIAKFEHGASIHSIAFSPVDISLLASAGGDTIKLWNQNSPDTPAEILRLEPYTDDVDSITFSPDGELLVTGGNKGITLWSVPEKRFINTFDKDTAAVAFSPDGQRIAEAAYDLGLWHLTDNGNFKKTLLFKHQTHDAFVQSIAFSPDGKWLVSGDAQGYIKVWDVQNERAVIPPLKGGTARIRTLKFSHDPNHSILASAGPDGDVKLWRPPEWQIVQRISTGTVLDLAFSPNGNMLASLGWDTIDLWSIENGAHIISFKKRARAVAFSITGTTLATGGLDGTVRLWNVAPSVISQQLEKQDIVRIVYFLPKGSRPQLNIRSKIDKMIRKIQHFYAEEIESHRFDRKSFVFETDQEREAQVYLITGKYTAEAYLENTLTKVGKEIEKHFDLSRNVYFLIVELGSQKIDDNVCGQGRVNPIWSGGEVWQTKTGLACIPTFKNCFNWQTAAHELGHAFGLKHDFRDDDYLMSYGRTPDRLSQAAAHWLSQTRFFKPNQPFFDKPATIEMFHASPPTQFKITDANGIHQVQLHVVPTDAVPPSGYKVSRNKERNQRSWEEFKTDGEFMLQSYYRVNGESQTTIDLPSVRTKHIRIHIIDMHGNITWRKFNLGEDDQSSLDKP